jgi:hypothetical protein
VVRRDGALCDEGRPIGIVRPILVDTMPVLPSKKVKFDNNDASDTTDDTGNQEHRVVREVVNHLDVKVISLM